jgi:hypothetical protein
MAIWHRFKGMLVGSDAPRRASGSLGGEDKRLTLRRRQRFIGGFIWSDRMAASKACNIRDLSATGARVDLLNSAIKAHTLTGILTLYLPAEKQEIDCQVMWRAGDSIGLRFLGAYRAPTRQYGASRI